MIFSNKKKIRGWKRKIKALEKCKLNNLNLDTENLLKNKYDYVKIWLDPFYRLTKRQPPNWFNKKIIEAFDAIFNSWEKDLKKLNKKYYLKLWLFEPNFISSQIVCAIESKIKHYDNIFYKIQEKKLSLNKYANNNFLNSLNFELGIDEYYIFSNDNIYTTKELENFKKLAYRVEKINASEEYYFIKVGYVWLGHR